MREETVVSVVLVLPKNSKHWQ